MRFSRPLSVYSPLFDRRILLKSVKPPPLDDDDDDETTDDQSQDEHDQSSDSGPEADDTVEDEASLTEGSNKPLHRAFKKFNFQVRDLKTPKEAHVQ